MSARERILGRLREAQAPALSRPLVDPARVAAIVPPTTAVPADRLRASLEAFHAEVIDVTAANWPTVLARVCQEKGVKTLAVGRACGLPADFSAARLRVFDAPLETWKHEFFDTVDAGFCRADCAIAEPGMLVLLSSPEQPRTLSLVPPINICLVDSRRLHPTLLAALHAEQWERAMPSNLIFISGPSKTADIQQTLAYGAHGPKELVVLLLAPEAGQ